MPQGEQLGGTQPAALKLANRAEVIRATVLPQDAPTEKPKQADDLKEHLRKAPGTPSEGVQ